ncbi:Uncharacterised protein [Collinsella intestinalis]|jgi:hypothetical protein|uniref:Uncharacterized protein n=1 Tax=Siphoviridae sp. ctDuC3 TaxID=2827563 RepID=A0A8S5LMX8_9CAUD|nr:Uncharacterised protein [Collinsella intestinalis]DAD71274.1 MAG TPA: hypothetical protein [Siphoviridae sp. ctDuC3]
MLDLTAINANLYQIKMADGETLTLKRPTQALFESIIKIGELSKNSTDSKVMEQVMEIFCRILNRNTSNKSFTLGELQDDYDFTVALMVIGDYMKYYADEITAKVNFQVAQ